MKRPRFQFHFPHIKLLVLLWAEQPDLHLRKMQGCESIRVRWLDLLSATIRSGRNNEVITIH